MQRFWRKRSLRVLAVVLGLFVLAYVTLGGEYHSRQFSRVVPMEGAGPVARTMPPEIEFTSDQQGSLACSRPDPNWELKWVYPLVTLDTASRRLHWTVRFNDLPAARLAGAMVDTGYVRDRLVDVQAPEADPAGFDRERYCRNAVELDLGVVSNNSEGEAVLSEAQMADLIDGRWAVRLQAPPSGLSRGPSDEVVLMNDLWVPYDVDVPSRAYRTVRLEAEPRDPGGWGRKKLWPDGDVDVNARADTRTHVLEFGINGKLRGAGTIRAVRFHEDGQPGVTTDTLDYLQDEFDDAGYRGRVTLTDGQMAAALDQRLRIGIELAGQPGREASGFLYLHGYTDHTPAKGETPLQMLQFYLLLLSGFRPGGG